MSKPPRRKLSRNRKPDALTLGEVKRLSLAERLEHYETTRTLLSEKASKILELQAKSAGVLSEQLKETTDAVFAKIRDSAARIISIFQEEQQIIAAIGSGDDSIERFLIEIHRETGIDAKTLGDMNPDAVLAYAKAALRRRGVEITGPLAAEPLEGSSFNDSEDIAAAALDALTPQQRKLVRFLLDRKHWALAETIKTAPGAFRAGPAADNRAVASAVERINRAWLDAGIAWTIESRDNIDSPAYRLRTGN